MGSLCHSFLLNIFIFLTVWFFIWVLLHFSILIIYIYLFLMFFLRQILYNWVFVNFFAFFQCVWLIFYLNDGFLFQNLFIFGRSFIIKTETFLWIPNTFLSSVCFVRKRLIFLFYRWKAPAFDQRGSKLFGWLLFSKRRFLKRFNYRMRNFLRFLLIIWQVEWAIIFSWRFQPIN